MGCRNCNVRLTLRKASIFNNRGRVLEERARSDLVQEISLFGVTLYCSYHNDYRGAKDLFGKLCNPNTLGRYSAKEALQHPWITE